MTKKKKRRRKKDKRNREHERKKEGVRNGITKYGKQSEKGQMEKIERTMEAGRNLEKWGEGKGRGHREREQSKRERKKGKEDGKGNGNKENNLFQMKYRMHNSSYVVLYSVARL